METEYGHVIVLCKAVTGQSVFTIGMDLERSWVFSGLLDSH